MTPEVLTALIDATWPSAGMTEAGGFAIRRGMGAGSRVSASTALIRGSGDIAKAEAAMLALGQSCLFMVRAGEEALDADLAKRGYVIKDPVTAYAASPDSLTTEPLPPLTCIDAWPPLAIMTEIWAAGGIGPARLAVMERAGGPKTSILGRAGDRAAGTLFVALDGPTAMVHAIEVLPRFRRQGVAARMIRRAAFWAAERGARRVMLLVTTANPANALYSGLGMAAEAGYHYRIKEAT